MMTWIVLGISFFRLVVPPLQPGVVGPYPVRGVRFSSRLPLEGTDRILNFGRYPGYFTPITLHEIPILTPEQDRTKVMDNGMDVANDDSNDDHDFIDDEDGFVMMTPAATLS
jgi:hypothetical protein